MIDLRYHLSKITDQASTSPGVDATGKIHYLLSDAGLDPLEVANVISEYGIHEMNVPRHEMATLHTGFVLGLLVADSIHEEIR